MRSKCSICCKSFDEKNSAFVQIGEKGANGINKASQEKGKDIKVTAGEFDVEYRKQHVRPEKRKDVMSFTEGRGDKRSQRLSGGTC